MKHLTADEADLYYCTSFPAKEEPWTAGPRRTYTARVSLDHDSLRMERTSVVKPRPQEPVPKSPEKTKRVRFGKVITRTYRQRTPTKAERKALWYSGREIRDMRTEICALNMSAAAMDPHKRSQLAQAYESSDTWRGLEHVRDGSLLKKVEHRRNFVQAFLYFSQELGVSDPSALAVFSSTNSKNDRLRAIELAKQDAMDACQIYYSFLTQENASREAQAAEEDGKRQNQTTPKGRRQRRQSRSTPRHHSEKKPLQAQVFNLTRSL